MRMYRKKRLRARVWLAFIGISFAAGILCGVLCERLNTEPAAGPVPDSEKLIVTAETVREEAEVLPQYEITPEERELIERVVAAEARGESYAGQKAVAEVIYNRCTLWNKSATEILLAKSQFAKPYSGEIPESAKNAVADVFDNGHLMLDGATHFHADYVQPYWAEKKVFVVQIGVHKFYKGGAV